EGAYRALRDDHRGRKRKRNPLEEENERLRTQVACPERCAHQAETIIERSGSTLRTTQVSHTKNSLISKWNSLIALGTFR
ncbi:MAG TPA: hypothetical protein PKJ23_02140, partial [bacterium]|nr:hypothetical protein [bacterium]